MKNGNVSSNESRSLFESKEFCTNFFEKIAEDIFEEITYYNATCIEVDFVNDLTDTDIDAIKKFVVENGGEYIYQTDSFVDTLVQLIEFFCGNYYFEGDLIVEANDDRTISVSISNWSFLRPLKDYKTEAV